LVASWAREPVTVKDRFRSSSVKLGSAIGSHLHFVWVDSKIVVYLH
jgi:hypothetical protein